jgi:NACalpha-BTF3-like transcription factor
MMGFKDREENIKALIESKGDVDGAIERLCKD